MIKFIDTRLTDSTVADPNDSCLVNDYRTSQSASLGYFEDDFFLNIDKKLVNLLDLNPFIGENMQGQKYLPGNTIKNTMISLLLLHQNIKRIANGWVKELGQQ